MMKCVFGESQFRSRTNYASAIHDGLWEAKYEASFIPSKQKSENQQ